MALFNRSNTESKDDKDRRKADEKADRLRALLEKHGLNIEFYSDDELKAFNKNDINNISLVNSLFSNSLYRINFSKEDQAKLAYLNSLIDQNWILIRQNELILRQLASK